ncbi:MAG: hypothetical protein ACAI44_34780 [Candidatus Sericytochromatia bacterium]
MADPEPETCAGDGEQVQPGGVALAQPQQQAQQPGPGIAAPITSQARSRVWCRSWLWLTSARPRRSA